MTDARNTQSAIEQWANPSPQARETQVAVEMWGLTGTVATQATVTQVALEEWALIAAASVGQQTRAWVMA